MNNILNLTDRQFGWWLTGLIDGEGHLAISKYTNKRKDGTRRGPYYRCALKISMVDLDQKMIKAVHERLGIGNVHYYDRKTKRADGKLHKSIFIWSVCSKNDLQVIVNHFDKYPLRSKKKFEYEIWRNAVVAQIARKKPENKQYSSAHWLLAEYYDKLKVVRNY